MAAIMNDVRLLVQEEGRAARNLVAFNVPVQKTNGMEKVMHKPPSIPRVLHSTASKISLKTSTRVRSASTGRDKRSELQARYWAFLFGNLQRAVDAIYQTCEENENILECKEVIMVLDNYGRDFYNLIDWFKVKWAYESSPPPQRKTSLAWEVRKTSPCRMWNGGTQTTATSSKPCSPVHLKSDPNSTCTSPTREVDNKVANTAEKEVAPSRNVKIIKDSKNLDSKIDSQKSVAVKSPVKQDEKNTANKEISNVKVNKPIAVAKPKPLNPGRSNPEPKVMRSKTSMGFKAKYSNRQTALKRPPDKRAESSKDRIQGATGDVLIDNYKPPANHGNKLVDVDGWQTVRSRYRRGSSHNLNMATRFHKPSAAYSLPVLCIESAAEKTKKNCLTPENGNSSQKRRTVCGKVNKNMNNEAEKVKADAKAQQRATKDKIERDDLKITQALNDTNSTSMIAAIFKNEAELLEKRIQQFMAAQAERERIILEEERKVEEADSQRSQQLSDEEAALQQQILELESSEIDVDIETDETDGEVVSEIDEGGPSISPSLEDNDVMSLEDQYENMLEGMSWAERMDTLAQLEDLVARHPGRALELHQKLSSPSRKRSIPETLRRFQAKQACAQKKRQKLLMEKSQRLRELLNKVEDVKTAKNQLIEDKRVRMELKLKRAEENRTQHLLEVVRKAHDEESKLKEIAFINELEAQNKRHDFMALCQEQEERLQGIQEERQRKQEEKAAKEAAAEERRRALEAERQLRIQKMRQVRREREERVGKMQLEREKERQELAREKARDREERLSALHAAQLANQEELQKKIAQKQQESARRHVENIEHIRQRAVESSIMRSEEVPPTLKTYVTPKQCSLCNKTIPNEVHLISHLRGKVHLEAVRKMHDGREPNRDDLQKFNVSQIKDVAQSPNLQDDNKIAKEKQKALKRRSRKIKQRLTSRSQEYEESVKSGGSGAVVADSANKSKFRKNLKELEKLCQSHSKTIWSVANVASLDRFLGDTIRSFAKSCSLDQDAFAQLGGFETLTSLLNLGLNVQNTPNILPNKSIASTCKIYALAVSQHNANMESILLSNKIIVILDLLVQRLESVTSLDDVSQAHEITGNPNGNGSVAVAVVQLLSALVPEVPFEKTALQSRMQDIVGYLVTSGLVDRVKRHGSALVESDFLVDQDKDATLLVACYDLLTRFCAQLNSRPKNPESVEPGSPDANQHNNPAAPSPCSSSSSESHFLSLLLSSEAAGAVGALYVSVALTSKGVVTTTSSQVTTPTVTTPTAPAATQALQAGLTASAKNLAYAVLRFLKHIAMLDLNKLQMLLGSEGTSLQWRLIASHLIGRLSRELQDKPDGVNQGTVNSVSLLSELFTVLGYFAINNPDNQLVLQTVGSGQSVLQQLCTLSFPFYSDPKLASFTLPTLLASTHENVEAKAVLSCEISYKLLEEYRDSEAGKLNALVRLLN